jgi:para-nitrobenzyl esterase
LVILLLGLAVNAHSAAPGANNAPASAPGPINSADVTGGRLQGTVADGIASFKGIPFAAPPIGELRWHKPVAVIPWSGTRKADTYAPACIQPWGMDGVQPTEDCLYLNVWTGATSSGERRPVIVWIHGGGFRGGMSWERLSDGTRLAKEGVVVVNIAYRLGASGFLSHPDLARESGKSAGNYGLWDMIAALQWVQANIARFGGDPNRVTLVGGSAGGFAVSVMVGSPTAKGLFQRSDPAVCASAEEVKINRRLKGPRGLIRFYELKASTRIL